MKYRRLINTKKKYQRRNKVYDFEEEISCNRFLMHNLGLSF